MSTEQTEAGVGKGFGRQAGGHLQPVAAAGKVESSSAPDAARLLVSDEAFQTIGSLTRHLHDTMNQLSLLARLKDATDGLPDARSRLNFVATKTAEAATKVLNLVDQAKVERDAIRASTAKMASDLIADPVDAVVGGKIAAFVDEVESRTAAIDTQLTEIMVAQDFQDLTGQVVSKVIALTSELEASLVNLLVEAIPEDRRAKLDKAPQDGPVFDADGRTDVARSQSEVDDLLSSLGF